MAVVVEAPVLVLREGEFWARVLGGRPVTRKYHVWVARSDGSVAQVCPGLIRQRPEAKAGIFRSQRPMGVPCAHCVALVRKRGRVPLGDGQGTAWRARWMSRSADTDSSVPNAGTL